jgi:HEAT repeat protein
MAEQQVGAPASGATYPTFDAVRGLTETSLRGLLRAGDPIERAWAAWQLGLRLGQEARPDLVAAVEDSPTPGVRSLILVVLAGYGERELVEAYARDDPDADVRAAACRSLAGITPPSDQTAVAFLVERLAVDASPIVRRELLALALDERIQPTAALVERQLTDPDRYVRQAAVALMTRRSDLGLTAALQTRLVNEPDDEVWEHLVDAWLRSGAHREFLGSLGASNAPLRRQDQGLGHLAAAAVLAPWRDLQPFAAREATVTRWLPRLVEDPTEAGALSWLLWLSSRRYDEIPPPTTRAAAKSSRAAWEAIAGATERILSVLPLIQADQLSPDDRRNAARLRRSMETCLRLTRGEYLADDGIDLDSLPAEELPDDYRSWRDGVAELRRIGAETDVDYR